MELDIATNPIKNLDTLTGLAERRFNAGTGGEDGSMGVARAGRPLMVCHNIDTDKRTWYSVISLGPGKGLRIEINKMRMFLIRRGNNTVLGVPDGVTMW
jgi:hypothetical protein